MAPETPANDSAQFAVSCPKCGMQASIRVDDRRAAMKCPGCGAEVDLATDEVKHARLAAAAKASIQTHQGGG